MKKHANVAIFVPHAGCVHACSFCDQHMISGESAMPSPEKVTEILRDGLNNLGERAKDAQIAFFGGSFTAIPEAYRILLLEAAQPFIGENGYSGIRVSTRPDYMDSEIASGLKYYNVVAVELGAQSMDMDVLTMNNRGHTPDDVRKASEVIKCAGISLGHQMMTGLYGSTPEKELYTARELVALKPDTMRIYPTAVLEGTALASMYKAGEYAPPSLDESVEICSKLLLFFIEEGINVIRLGLHGGSFSDNVIAGACHPAFRELCESKIICEQIVNIINTHKVPTGEVNLRVNPADISRAVGHKKSTLLLLREMGYELKIIKDENQKSLNINIV